MAGVSYGSGSGDWREAIARAQVQARATDELNQKEEQRRSVEERASTTERQSATTRSNLGTATGELTTRLQTNIGAIEAETAAMRANIAAMEQSLSLRQRIAGSPLISAGSTRAARGVSAAGGVVALEEDPGAVARLSAAQRALAAAEIARTSAQGQIRTATRGGTTAEGLAPLVEQRELATQQVTAARAELRAAQANVAAQQALAQQRQQQMAEQQQINAALQAERAAAERAAAAASAVAVENAAAGRQPLLLGPGRAIQLGGAGSTGPGGLDYGRGIAGPPRYRPPTVIGGPAESIALPAGAAGEELQGYRDRATGNAAALRTLATDQHSANAAFQEASAIYAGSSNALSRHGALTTEFIQALARGQVSLQEFSSQMVATIGKFGGWVVAGAAVYGVYKLFKDLTQGATETQAAVENLGRFIPGLGGPAGGGSGQIGHAEGLVRNLSTQFNVPISEVTAAMVVVARVFHNLADAGAATQAVLAASRLDQIPQEAGTRYLIGISQSLGLSRGSQLVGVVNSLNTLQSQFGARVSQTLPALALAAPAAVAGGVNLPTLEALAALGVRAGLTGPQVGTGLLRSIGTFSQRPASQEFFATQGIQPQLGNYQALIEGVVGVIDRRSRAGRPLSGVELRGFAQALGGPLLGTRTILPLLVQEQLHPGEFNRLREGANTPRPYQEDLSRVLDTVSERFKSIGIALQNFGSHLAEIGALTPIIALFDAFRLLTNVVITLASPFTDTISMFNKLPTILQDVIGAFLGFRVLRTLYNTSFGSTAQQFVGRLPGLSALGSQDRGIVEGTSARLQTYLLPDARADNESSARRLMQARGRVVAAYDDLAQYEAANVAASRGATGSKNREQYEQGIQSRTDRIASLESQVGPSEQRLAESASQLANLEADLTVAKDKQYSFAERAALLEARGYVAQQETVNLQEQILAARRAQLEGLRGGGVAAGALGGSTNAAETEAALSATAGRVITNVSKDPAVMSSLAAGVTAATAGAATARAAESFAAPEAGIFAQLGLAGAVSGVQARYAALRGGISEAGGLAAYARAGVSGAVDRAQAFSGAAPLAGLIGSQLLGGLVPGSTGNYISSVGGTAFTTALLAQMLGRSGAGGFALGSVLGNFQQSTSAGVGSLAGGGIGALIGSLIEPGGGTLLGGAIGSGVGGFIGNLFGGSQPSPADQQQKADQQALRLLRQAGGGGADAVAAFGDTFSNALAVAFTGTGSAASAAQSKVTAILKDLTAQLALFGSASSEGKRAEAELSQVVNAAVSTFGTDPGAAKQIIDGAQSAISGIVTRATAFLKYGSRASAPGTEKAAVSQIGAITAATRQQLSDEEAQLASWQRDLAQTSGAGGSTATLGPGGIVQIGPTPAQGQRTALMQQIAQTKTKIGNLKQTLQYLNALVEDGQEQVADQYLQLQEALTNAKYQSLSATTPSKLDQARFALAAANKNIVTVQTTKGISPKEQAQQLASAQQARRTALDNLGQTETAQLQAVGQVAIEAIPSVDIVARAAGAVREQAAIYDFMKAHAKLFDPTAIAGALAQLEGAQQGLTDAIYQHQSELIQAEGQLAQAEARGDPALQATAAARTAQQMLAIARTPAQRISAQAGVVQAGVQAQEAARSTADLQSQIATESDYGNTVQQANDAIAAANRQLSLAQNTQEKLQAQVALLKASHQLQQAIADRYTELGALAASETVNPVKQLSAQLNAAAKALAVTTGYDNRVKARTNLNQLTHQYEQGLIDQRTSIIDFQFQMMEITAGQAVKQLEDLTHLKGITLAQRQQLLEQIRRYQLGLETPIGATGFDLAPGSIKLPTYYDVAHAIQSPRASLLHSSTTVVSAPQITVYVRNSRDVPKVADVLEHAMGGVKAKLRASGVK